MRIKSKSILVNMKADGFGAGIVIGRSFIKASHSFKEVERAHRDDYHLFIYLFILQEKGNTPL